MLKFAMPLAAAALAVLVAPEALLAQERCAEGREAGGKCVNAALSQTVRKQTVIRTQSRLSVNSPPALPSADAAAKDPAMRAFIRREQSATHP